MVNRKTKTTVVLLVAIVLMLSVHVVDGCYTFNVATDFLNGVHGVTFNSNTLFNNLGYVVSSAGDVNGDGFDDLLVLNGDATDSPLYLVWGRNTTNWLSFAAGGSVTFDAASTSSANYVVIHPHSGCHSFGSESLTSCADVNADGFSDVLVGSRDAIGCGFTIWGHADPWNAQITAGVAPGLTFVDTASTYGQYPAACGDINGDGVEDVLVGTYTGVPVVVFGTNTYLNTQSRTITINNLDGTDGFRITGYHAYSGFTFGYFERVGDINGDGVDDLLFGAQLDNTLATNAGRAFVIFGRRNNTLWDAEFDINTFDGTNGFIINGPPKDVAKFGRLTSGAGDLNHDGIADFFISTTHDGFVIFGHSGTWTSPFSVTTLNGTNGFSLQDDSTTTWFASSGGAVGDMNGDDIDDLVVGDRGSKNSTGTAVGSTWVLYGHSGAWPATITRSDISGTAGFEIVGPSANSNFGQSAAHAGDINGDGIPDLVIGAPYANNNSGQAFLMFGIAFPDECEVCDISGTCSQCDAGYGLDTNRCTACTDKQYNYPVGLQCRDCSLSGGCLACDKSNGQCTQCPVGKAPDGTGCKEPVDSDTNTATAIVVIGNACAMAIIAAMLSFIA